MDPRERMNSLLVTMRAAMQRFQSDLWTALPGQVISYDSTKLTVVVQPMIQCPVRLPSGALVNTTLPVCPDVPVIFPSGGGFVLTFPVAAGDEGLIIFSSRCIDAWWQQGGVQPQAELRMHDLSDGFFLPGAFSVPRVPASTSVTAAELRSLDGDDVVHLEDGKFTASLGAGRTSLVVDDGTQKVQVAAVNGLWVNGVRVTVP